MCLDRTRKIAPTHKCLRTETAFGCQQGLDLQLIDTPGANSMSGRVEHNVWIAHALNFCPVSLILLVVKAEVRMDATMAVVTDYMETEMY